MLRFPPRRLRVRTLLLLAAVCTPLLLAETASAQCTNPNDRSLVSRSDRCIGDKEFSARGVHMNSACLLSKPVVGEIYPSNGFCGGNGRGAEAIAQARAVARLNGGTSSNGVDPKIQFEIYTNEGSGDRSDLTYWTGNAIEVYEAKVNVNKRNPYRQVDGYIGHLNAAGVQPRAQRGSSLSNAPLGVYLDAFAVVSRKECIATADNGGGKQYEISAYVSWKIAPGVIHVHQFGPYCFDPGKVPPPLPVPGPVVKDEKGGQVRIPTGSIPKTPWVPAPGTTLPSPATCCATPPLPPITSPPRPSGGGSYGDPHMTTFDGLAYDFMVQGEFQLARSESLGVDVQMRALPWNAKASYIDRVAFGLNGHTVEIDGWNDTLWFDSEVVKLKEGETWDLADGAYLMRIDGAYVANWPSTEASRPVLWMRRNAMQFWVPRAGDISGLLGDNDGSRDNDFVTRDGRLLAADSPKSVLYRDYADSWRIHDDESLFTYATEDDGTGDYTDRTFPTEYLALGDLSDEDIAAGSAACEAGGVVHGPQFDACVMDWALTQDQSFVEAAAAQTDPVVEAGARGLDALGNLSESFDGDVPVNLGATKYGSGAGTGRFAGPFGRDGQYILYVPDIVRSEATVELNLITFGTWSPFDQTGVDVTINGRLEWRGSPGALPTSATGVTAGGVVYAVHPLALDVGHPGGSLSVSVTGEVPLGSTRAFAIDEIALRTRAVPSQLFGVTLPAAIDAEGTLPGAGRMETVASEDVYEFTTTGPVDAPLLFDFEDCTHPDTIVWEIWSKTTGKRLYSGTTCRNTAYPGAQMPAGTYQFKVRSNGRAGTYKLGISHVPAQRFAITLPAEIRDGLPLPGAGNVETTASLDSYRFTTTGLGSLRVEFSDCDPEAEIEWTLRAPATGNSRVANGYGCKANVIPNLVDGSKDPVRGTYELEVRGHPGQGAYRLDLRVEPAEEAEMPVPFSAAGNLETGASSDTYWFSPSTDGRLAIKLSDCSSAMSELTWRIISEDGARIADGEGCGTQFAGWSRRDARNRLVIDNPGVTGTYGVELWTAPDEEERALTTMPVARDGALETIASEDVYTFTPKKGDGLDLVISDCSEPIRDRIRWTLTDDVLKREVGHGGCYGGSWTDLPARELRLTVTALGSSGTYKVAMSTATPQQFGVTVPAAIRPGVPASGAGNLETRVSADVYTFFTLGGKLKMAFSECGVHQIKLRHVDPDTGHSGWASQGCWQKTLQLTQGWHQLVIDAPGAAGTYKLDLSLEQMPEEFTTSLPATIPDGVAGLGVGNLENGESMDVYAFGLWEPAAVRFDFSDCSESLGDEVDYELVSYGGTEVIASGTTCSRVELPILPAAGYQLKVKRPGRSGTYKAALDTIEAVDRFDVSLPFTVADGRPGEGAGRMETMKSTDLYRFSMPEGGRLQMEFTHVCEYAPDYELRNALTAEVIEHDRTCDGVTLPEVPPGEYELLINKGQMKPYTMRAYVAPDPEVADVSLPFDRSGALETTSSVDVYRFAASGPLKVEFSDCTTETGYVDWTLTDEATGEWWAGWPWGCNLETTQNLPAGNYRLSVNRNKEVGTYRLRVGAAPQSWAVTLPANVWPNAPRSGMGNLEMTSSEDVYRLTTASAGGLRLDLSACSTGLGGAVDYTLTDAGGARVASGSACASTTIPNVPAGDYRVSITRPGRTGTYHLKLLTVPAPDTSDVTLPASVNGNLETAASEDVYRFATSAAGPLQVELSTCSSALGGVNWTLLNASGATVASSSAATCSSTTVANLPAGGYRLSVTRAGRTGTYRVAVRSVPPQTFDITLPANVNGNIETALSEDVYRFTTTSTGGVRLAFSTCSSALGKVSWKLVNAATGAPVASNASSCATTTVPSVPAGSYRVSVTGNGKTGTYKLGISRA